MNNKQDQLSKLFEIDCVIADSLGFRRKLAIGESVCNPRLLGGMFDYICDGSWMRENRDMFSVPFPRSPGHGLPPLGFGLTATTPFGWLMRAAVITGGTHNGVMQLHRLYSETRSIRITPIPKFINTPIDLLGAGLLDLIGSLTIKVAMMDGNFTDDERVAIAEYLTEEWGYSPAYVGQALSLIEHNIHEISLSQMLENFTSFAKANPDCNFTAMWQELLAIERIEEETRPNETVWQRFRELRAPVTVGSAPSNLREWMRDTWNMPWAVKSTTGEPN